MVNSETTYQPDQGKQMSLDFPGIISLQIQVTSEDFESWINYWTIPLSFLWDILFEIYDCYFTGIKRKTKHC